MARRCSYCYGAGHNRRTCTVLMEDKKVILKAAKKRRKQVAAALQKVGFAPGAIVSAPQHSWGDRNTRKTYLINKIDLDGLVRVADFTSYVISVRDVKALNKRSSLQLCLLPVMKEFEFIPRHHDEKERWNIRDRMYVNPENTYHLLSPSPGAVHASEELDSRTKQKIFRDFNILPSSYRASDKERLNSTMERINNFINAKC